MSDHLPNLFPYRLQFEKKIDREATMQITAIQSIVGYHFARFCQVWTSIQTLTDEQFLAKTPYSHGSLRNQMVHVINDDLSWLKFLENQPKTDTYRPANFTTIAYVRNIYDSAEEEILEFVSEKAEACLHQAYLWHPPIAEVPQRLLGWQVFLHMVNHGTDHRAQILRVLHDFGAATFDQDLMGYWVQSGILDVK